MENQIDEEIKQTRADSIMREADGYFPRSQRGKSGTHFRGPLVDGRDEEGAYIGRTQYDAEDRYYSDLSGPEQELVPGDLLRSRDHSAFDYDIVGRMEE